ncbi:MAG: PrsW family intramembrane metalloprotease [Bacteroidales bacterium]|nr:PrsW family intramembrane metalloprotease [Bacteroidales bacterium]
MKFIAALLPVIAFLLVLIYLDSFKLIRKNVLIYSIVWGICAAILSYFVNNLIVSITDLNNRAFCRAVSPPVEETLKSLFLIFLVMKGKIGFRIDGAIYGFAIGAGFALYENIFFLHEIPTDNMWLWIIRGFGTAIMHGGVTSILGVLLMHAREKNRSIFKYLGLGLLLVILIHSLFNHFLLPPLASMFIILIIISVVEIAIFQVNERLLREWLELEFDSEVKLLAMIRKGEFLQSKPGKYLISIRQKFSKFVVLDMLSYISLYLELSVRAKGNLMLKESGLPVKKDIEVTTKLLELKSLEKNIGKTGLMAISPILRISKKNIIKWSLL